MKITLLTIYMFCSLMMGPLLGTESTNPLVVSYATSHLNGIKKAVVGVLVAPGGTLVYTDPMGPFDQFNIVVTAEAGTYKAYFQTLEGGAFRLCPIVGGICALLANSPERPIAFSRKDSHIQVFPAGKKIEIGSLSKPTAYFTIASEDL